MPAFRKRFLSPLSPEPGEWVRLQVGYTKTKINMGCWPRLSPTFTNQTTRRSGPTMFPSGGNSLTFRWDCILLLL